MTTVQAFNGMLKNFMEELADVFPEEHQIRVFLDGFDALTMLTPRMPMDMFVDSLAPHASLAMAKDPDLFTKLEFPGGIDFQRLWASPDVSDNTRDAIWQYINLLYVLGSTVRSMPAEMLEGIESVAKTCADKMQSGQMDLSALGGMLMSGLGSSGGGMGGMGALASLLGGGDEDTPAADTETRVREPRQAHRVAGARRPARKH